MVAGRFANDPLGTIPTRYLLAHTAIIGRRWASTPRAGEEGPQSTASRLNTSKRYWSAFT